MARRTKKVTVTSKNELTVSPWTLDAVQLEDLRVRLAKRANQRIVRLERRKASTGEYLSEFSPAQYAYEQIKKTKTAENKPITGKLRFKEGKRPLGDAQSRMEVYAMQSFLSMETSKAGKAARYVSKTEQTFKERGIAAAGYKSFYNFLNSAAFASLKGDLNSNDIVDLYNKAHDEGNSFKKIDAAIADYLAALEEKEQPASLKDLAKAMGTTYVV